jgi:hypothetical protein
MICPKCGKEYEGKECPNCSKPEIVVNQSDYLKRREAYEKKQAEERSASSVNADKNDSISPENKAVKEKNAVDHDIKEKEAEEYPEINYLEVLKKATSLGKDAANKAAGHIRKEKTAENDRGAEHTSFFTKHKRVCAVMALLLAVCIAAAVGIYRLAIRKNYVLYMSYNDKIYNVAELESDYVCDSKDAVFAADDKTFFTPDLADTEFISTLASDDGAYIAGVTYKEDTAKYSLYVWKSSGGDVKKVSENTYNKEIKYITSSGKVIYTDVEIVNDEGAVGEMNLYIYNAQTEKLTMVEQQLRSVAVYAGNGRLVCFNKDNELYIYDYEKMQVSDTVSENANSVYAKNSKSELFTNKSESVNTQKNTAFVYGESSSWYYYDLSTGKSTYICAESGTNAEFIYEEKAGFVYVLLPKSVSCAEITQDGVSSFSVTDSLSSSDYIYISRDKTLVYVNSDGELIALTKNKKKTIDTGITASTLSLVDNTDTGFTYVKDGYQYYRSSTSAQAVEMQEVADVSVLRETCFYKNQLYFYNDEGKLCSCTKKGKNLRIVGDVDRFWLGTEYK